MDLIQHFLKLEVKDFEEISQKINKLYKSLLKLEKTVDAITKVLDETMPAIADFVTSRKSDVMETDAVG